MIALCALMLVGTGPARAPIQDKAYLIAYNPPLKKALHYDIETVVTGPSAATLKLAKTVRATQMDNGIFTVVTTFDSVSFGIPANEQVAQAERLIKSSVVTQTINSQGGIVSSDASRSVSQMLVGGLDAINAIAFSPTPVKVGDTWRNSIDNSGSKLEVELKLVGVRNEHGKQVASLKMGTVTSSTAEPELPLVIDVDLATGVLQRLEFADKTAAGAKGSSIHVLIRLR